MDCATHSIRARWWSDMPIILEVKDLQTRFKTYDGLVYAVNGISYELNEGETLGVVGESGCGKSVSVLSIMGLIPQPPGLIAGGQALYRDFDLLKKSNAEMRHIRGKEIAMVFQDPMTSLNPVLTIGFQISEALQLHMAMNVDQAQHRTVELLEMVGIPQANRAFDNYPHQFSGGMRQRAMIAMAIACMPQILIADEPTTALDVTIQAQIVELVKRLRDEIGMAIIWITHDLGIIAGLAQRVIVMYAGFIVEHASVDEVYDNPRHPYTISLLGALPRVDMSREERLTSIPGLPPNLIGLPKGCPFAPRCRFVVDRCRQENPPLTTVAPNHEIACWVNVQTGDLR
jgi:oligopeptide transport system ATP-binding protein